MTDEKIEDTPQLPEDEGQLPLMIDEASSDEAIDGGNRRRKIAADEEDETWTNQPSAADADSLEDALDDQDDEDEEEEAAPTPRKVIETARDVVCEELPDRALRAATRLKPFLTGTFIFDFTNSGERFLFDWRGDTPSTRQLAREMTVTCDEAQGHVFTDNSVNVDTVVLISESHLMAVRSGSLNPQVAMLTDKIRIKGKVGPAVYIFNVVAPRPRQ
ncbi:MAG: SCP2 sterol-binding domain-containing protein [Pseudomonadota bacterium]|jgi:hypothetical protein